MTAVHQSSTIAAERRSCFRYRVGLELHYKLTGGAATGQEGSGKTRDFSKDGVLFVPDRPLPPGLDVQLFIDWPARINGSPALHATISGRIVRSDPEGTAVKIACCRFRPGPAGREVRTEN